MRQKRYSRWPICFIFLFATALTACGAGGGDGGGGGPATQVPGSLDTSFDTDGIVTTSIPGSTSADAFALARYTSSGALDTSFDADGIVTTVIGTEDGDDQAFALALQPDGKIVVAGFTVIGGPNFALARYNP